MSNATWAEVYKFMLHLLPIVHFLWYVTSIFLYCSVYRHLYSASHGVSQTEVLEYNSTLTDDGLIRKEGRTGHSRNISAHM